MALRVPLNYVEGLKTDDNSTLKFIGPNNGWKNLCGDELWCEKTSSYDVAMTTLSIPKGVYEVRVGYQASGNRGVVQFYFDGMPCGIPVDMNIKSDNASIGYVRQPRMSCLFRSARLCLCCADV